MPTDETIVSDSTLRFRDRAEIEASIAEVGLRLREVRDAPADIRGDRAMHYRLLENIDSGALDPNSIGSKSATGTQGRLGTASLRRTLPKQQAYLLDIYGQMLAAEKLEGKERIAAFAAVNPAQGTGFVPLLMGLLLPSMLMCLRLNV